MLLLLLLLLLSTNIINVILKDFRNVKKICSQKVLMETTYILHDGSEILSDNSLFKVYDHAMTKQERALKLSTFS